MIARRGLGGGLALLAVAAGACGNSGKTGLGAGSGGAGAGGAGGAWGGAANFYVATDGEDAWSGTLPAANAARTDGPFASLDHARAAVRALDKTGRLKIT